jgi:hypothetical protein
MRRHVVYAIAAGALVVAGCSHAVPAATPPGASAPTETGRATPTTSVALPGTPVPGSSDPVVADRTLPPGGCVSSTIVLEIDPRQPPPVPLCLRVGTQLRFSATSSPRQPWQPLASSAPTVLRCDSHPAVEGSIGGECTATNAGQSTLTTSTAAFAGDPHGPPQYQWTLEVTVVG